jgi:thiamine kinase-like enzyme
MTLEEQIRQLPCWQGGIDITTLDGGITNHNFLVKDGGQRYVVRMGRDIPVHQIMRFNELAANQAAHAAGLAPAVHFHADGVLVMDYINSLTLSPAAVREARMFERVLDLVRQCHTIVPRYLRGPSLVFWVFHVIRDYAATLRDGNSSHVHRLAGLLDTAANLEQAAAPFDIVFAHNDLLAANILDDGARLWLIDWEYGGFNTPLFDLGGLASNNELDKQQEQHMLESYSTHQ